MNNFASHGGSEGKSQKDSVKKEKKKVKDAEKDGIACDGLRIIGLKKTYF